MDGLELSIVVPTYNRANSLETIYKSLVNQKLDRSIFEIIFINDGSSDETLEKLEELGQKYNKNKEIIIRVLTQDNQGQAVARHHGVQASFGRVLIFLDDDMELQNDNFLQAHFDCHQQESLAVVYGAILPPKNNPKRPAFEYFYEKSISSMYQAFLFGLVKPDGQHFFSANVSMSKQIYNDAGGFDSNYRHAEDREFGLRIMNKTTANFVFCPKAAAYHNSTTGRFSSFINRARLYGVYDYKMSMLYPENVNLSPFYFVVAQNIFKSILIKMAENSAIITRLATKILAFYAKLFNLLRLRKFSVLCCSSIYIINYVGGLKELFNELQGKSDTKEIQDKTYQDAKNRYIVMISKKTGYSFWNDIKKDVEIILNYEDKPVTFANIVWLLFGSDGFPILLTYRIRKLAKKYHIPLVNRILRFLQTTLYSVELGIDIELEHGVYFVHSLGTVIGGYSTVGKGSILMGNNTVGAAHRTGSPNIKENTLIGAGARILGSITVGEHSVIGANSVVLTDIPAYSVAVGSPAKVVKSKITKEKTEANSMQSA